MLTDDALRRIGRLVRRIGLAVGVIVALVVPAGYVTVALLDMSQDLTFRASLSAREISEYAYRNDKIWRFKTDKHEELLRYADINAEFLQSIIGSDGDVLTSVGAVPAAPAMIRSMPIIVAGQELGRVTVEATMRPILWLGALAVSLGLVLGFGVYFSINLLPMRAVNRTFVELRRAQTELEKSEAVARRTSEALENVSGVVLMADLDGRVMYFNQAARKYFADAEGDIKTAIPGFQAAALEGFELASFVPDDQAARQKLAGLSETWTGRREFGRRTVELTANPVRTTDGGRLGTVVEWVDLSERLNAEAEKATAEAARRSEEDERRKLEQRFQADLAAFVEAAAAGDLSKRVDLTGRSGLMLQLGEGMNRWAEAVAKAMDEVVEMMAAMAEGDLSKRIGGDYKGELLRLKADSNATAEKLAGIVGQTVDGMSTIKAATEQLTAGAKDLSTRTEEQVAGLEEMAASIRQMSVTVKQNAENAQKAKDLAVTAQGAAESGGAVTGQAVAAVGQIEESAQKIAEIVGMMDEIAFQTNLLALNAAVEAARAGDAGRGFAVVAEEVRALAQRSSQASKEIKSLITTSGNQVKKGVELVNRAGSSLGEIVASVKKVAEIVSEIAAASQEQSAGIQQVNDTVTQMEGVTQKNASLVEESTASLNAVDRQVDGLSNVVAFFSVARSGARHLQSELVKRVPAADSASQAARSLQPEPPAARAGNWRGF